MHIRSSIAWLSLISALLRFIFIGGCSLSEIWMIPVDFAIIVACLTLVFWVVVLIVSLTVPKKKKYENGSVFYGKFFNFVLKAVCSEAGVKIKVTGKELIPDGNYLLVANHRSKFDNMVLSAVIDDPKLVFISKPENFSIPMGGRFMRRCGYLEIDRKSPKNAIKTVYKAAENIKEDGMSVGVFPEGTRGKGPGVADFSEGCFLIAKKAECPVVVAVVDGTEKIYKNFPLKKTEVGIEFITVIPCEEVMTVRSGGISEKARNIMQDRLLFEGDSEQ